MASGLASVESGGDESHWCVLCLQHGQVPRTVVVPSQTLLWGLAVGGSTGEGRSQQDSDWVHENIPGTFAGRTRKAGLSGPEGKTPYAGLCGLWH